MTAPAEESTQHRSMRRARADRGRERGAPRRTPIEEMSIEADSAAPQEEASGGTCSGDADADERAGQ